MPQQPLRIIPLGGLGEIGRNMMALEYDGDIVVIDAGVMFPEEDMPGVDFAISDISYLKANRERVRAILITHGHEDHIGGLPFLLAEINAPVYSSPLTNGLISVKLAEHRNLTNVQLNVIEPYSRISLGAFSAEFFPVCHSIPDAMGIAIDTPVGLVIHTGDFKIDHTPADGQPTDFSTLSRLSADGVLLLLSDSTYAEVEGYTESEHVVGEALDRLIGEANGRVMVATFASLISRIQQVINAATRHQRKVTMVGRSMQNNVKMALDMGYLTAPADTIVSMSQARQLPLDKIVIMATGSQGEPTSALVRIANRDHRDIEIVAGDTVIISASPIPGNETLISRTVDNLMRQGAHVLYSRIAMVHVHGHASQEELKMMLSVVRPRFFVPVHGEFRHLMMHASIARSMGIPESNAFVLEDGDVLELTREHGEVVDKVRAGPLFVDGHHFWSMDSPILGERMQLAREGVVTVAATLDARTHALTGKPEVAAYGFIELDESQDLFQKTSKLAASYLDDLGEHDLGLEQVKVGLSKSVADFLYSETRRRPTVLAVIEQI
jgi:ribonuclease J